MLFQVLQGRMSGKIKRIAIIVPMCVKVFWCHKLLPTALFWKSTHPYPLTLNYQKGAFKNYVDLIWPNLDDLPPRVDNLGLFKYYLYLFTWLSIYFLMTTCLPLHVHVGIECPQRKWVCIFLANGKKKLTGRVVRNMTFNVFPGRCEIGTRHFLPVNHQPRKSSGHT